MESLEYHLLIHMYLMYKQEWQDTQRNNIHHSDLHHHTLSVYEGRYSDNNIIISLLWIMEDKSINNLMIVWEKLHFYRVRYQDYP